MTSDNIDDLLAARPAPANGDKHRQIVLLRSTGVIRRRRRLKQLAWVGACAACFLGGMATMRWWMPAQPQVVQVQPEANHVAPPLPEVLSAGAQENRALDSADPRERAAGYHKAAELYKQEGDFGNWVRCKDNAVADAPREDLTVSVDDDFLTIALKRERQKKEKRDELKPN